MPQMPKKEQGFWCCTAEEERAKSVWIGKELIEYGNVVFWEKKLMHEV